MRVLATCIVAFGIVVSPAMAAGGAANDALGATAANNAAVATATVPNAPVAAATKESPAKPAESSMESELQQLRDLLEAQSKQLHPQADGFRLIPKVLASISMGFRKNCNRPGTTACNAPAHQRSPL